MSRPLGSLREDTDMTRAQLTALRGAIDGRRRPPYVGVAKLTAALESHHANTGPAEWLKPIADYERREGKVFGQARFG